ncbi:hypothetical protein PFISCL1PPCAC_21330, partial [Pristionchus fissidentatus]
FMNSSKTREIFESLPPVTLTSTSVRADFLSSTHQSKPLNHYWSEDITRLANAFLGEARSRNVDSSTAPPETHSLFLLCEVLNSDACGAGKANSSPDHVLQVMQIDISATEAVNDL